MLAFLDSYNKQSCSSTINAQAATLSSKMVSKFTIFLHDCKEFMALAFAQPRRWSLWRQMRCA